MNLFSYVDFLPHLFTLAIAIIASTITYIVSKRRIKLEATVEICRFRQKWLEQLRDEVAQLTAVSVKALKSNLSNDEKDNFYLRLSRVSLLVNESNQHWPELKESMGVMFNRTMGEKGLSEKTDIEPFLTVAKKILKDEWDEIQDILYEKNR